MASQNNDKRGQHRARGARRNPGHRAAMRLPMRCRIYGGCPSRRLGDGNGFQKLPAIQPAQAVHRVPLHYRQHGVSAADSKDSVLKKLVNICRHPCNAFCLPLNSTHYTTMAGLCFIVTLGPNVVR